MDFVDFVDFVRWILFHWPLAIISRQSPDAKMHIFRQTQMLSRTACDHIQTMHPEQNYINDWLICLPASGSSMCPTFSGNHAQAACTVVAWLSHDYTDHPVSNLTKTVQKEKIYFSQWCNTVCPTLTSGWRKKPPKHGAWESSLELITLVLKLIKSLHCVTFIFASSVNFSRNNAIYNINESAKYILSGFQL